MNQLCCRAGAHTVGNFIDVQVAGGLGDWVVVGCHDLWAYVVGHTTNCFTVQVWPGSMGEVSISKINHTASVSKLNRLLITLSTV